MIGAAIDTADVVSAVILCLNLLARSRRLILLLRYRNGRVHMARGTWGKHSSSGLEILGRGRGL